MKSAFSKQAGELRNLGALPRPLLQWGGLFAGTILAALVMGTLLVYLIGYPVTGVYLVEGKAGQDCRTIAGWLEPEDSLAGRISVGPASEEPPQSTWYDEDPTLCVVRVDERRGWLVDEVDPSGAIDRALGERARVTSTGAQMGNLALAGQWMLPLLAIGIFLVWRRLESRPPGFRPAGNGRAVGLGLGAFAVWILVSMPVLLTLALVLGLENPGGQAVAEALRVDPWMIAYAVIGGPLGEELLFRRMGYRLFLNRGFPVIGALATSGAFTAIHLQYFVGTGADTVVYPATILALSLVLSWLYYRTGRLLAPLIAHVCVNALAVGLALWATGA